MNNYSYSQDFLLKNRLLFERAGFVALTYLGRTTISFAKIISFDPADKPFNFASSGFDENLAGDEDVDVYELLKPPLDEEAEHQVDFFVVEVAADGMVKRRNGINGSIDGPFLLSSRKAREVLESAGLSLPLMDADLIEYRLTHS